MTKCAFIDCSNEALDGEKYCDIHADTVIGPENPSSHLVSGAWSRRIKRRTGDITPATTSDLSLILARDYDECGLAYVESLQSSSDAELASTLGTVKIKEVTPSLPSRDDAPPDGASATPFAPALAPSLWAWQAARRVPTTIQPQTLRIRAAVLFIPFDAILTDGRTFNYRTFGSSFFTLTENSKGEQTISDSNFASLNKTKATGSSAITSWPDVTGKKVWEKPSGSAAHARESFSGNKQARGKGAKDDFQKRVSTDLGQIPTVGAQLFYQRVLGDRLHRLGLFRGATFVEGLPRVVVLSEKLFAKTVPWPSTLDPGIGIIYRKLVSTGIGSSRAEQDICAYAADGTVATARWEQRKLNQGPIIGPVENWLILNLQIRDLQLNIGCVHLTSKNIELNSANTKTAILAARKFALNNDLDAILGDMNMNTTAFQEDSFHLR